MNGIRTKSIGERYIVMNTETHLMVTDALLLFPHDDPDAVEVVRQCGLTDWHKELLDEQERIKNEQAWEEK